VLQIESRSGLVDIAKIRMQVPLPETTDELCAVTRDLKADGHELRLGARATESEVKRLSQSGQLAQYRIVLFATHGALAGELKSSSEPGLLLTPLPPSPGIPGALWGGLLAAASVDPKVFPKFRA
jgi:CHAT domain-containing protein